MFQITFTRKAFKGKMGTQRRPEGFEGHLGTPPLNALGHWMHTGTWRAFRHSSTQSTGALRQSKGTQTLGLLGTQGTLGTLFRRIFFCCFDLCQVIKIAWVINRINFTPATKFLFFIGLISVKRLQSTKFKVKCYKCFINLEFKCDEYLRTFFFTVPKWKDDPKNTKMSINWVKWTFIVPNLHKI